MPRFDTERWRALNPYLNHALELEDTQLASWFSELRERDPGLAAELRTLLDHFGPSERSEFLEHSLGSLRASFEARNSDSLVGADGPRYLVRAEHARGGMGRILLATDRVLDRTVAIKELLHPDTESEARLLREIQLTARLQHPSIVPVHDAGRWHATGRLFYSMKLVSGDPLTKVVAATHSLSERLPLLAHVLAVSDAVAYAHSQAVIHRDLKPANVLIGAYGETLVVDWGLAKELDRATLDPVAERPQATSQAASLTLAGTVLGTPAFMPPEQARGLAVDRRADVYSLGALLYFVISADYPYAGDSSHEVLQQVLGGSPQPLRVREPQAPADLCAIVDKAMARNPDERYPSALELAADLRRFMTGQLVSAREYAWRHIALRWIDRHRALAALSGLFASLLLIGTVSFVTREQQLRRAAEAASRRADVQSQALLIEQGQHELEQGRPLRAAPYLAEAYAREPANLAVRYLTTELVRPLESHLHSLRGHTRDVVAVEFSPDGTQLATGSTDQTVRLWDARTGATLRVLEGPRSTIEDVACVVSHAIPPAGHHALS